MNKIRKTDSDRFYDRIGKLLVEARSSAVQAINKTMVHTYFEIGRMIVEEEQNGNIRAEYGKQVLIEFSRKLTDEFGKGFSICKLIRD